MMRLSKLYVKKALRGHNLGKALLQHAIEAARSLNYKKLDLTVSRNNLTTISWYKHHGFIIDTSEITDIGNGYVMDDYIMVKEL